MSFMNKGYRNVLMNKFSFPFESKFIYIYLIEIIDLKVNSYERKYDKKF